MFEQTVFHSNTDDLEMWVEYDHGRLTIQFMDEFGSSEKKYIKGLFYQRAILWLDRFDGRSVMLFIGDDFLEPDYDFRLKLQDFKPLKELFKKYKALQNELR